jgi:uncharacterized protein YdeI (YjbR/CyaY-like superfamily)
MNPKFFTSATKLRDWLEKNQLSADELWIGFHKKASGKKSITYNEALDEALCFGWIDGIRKTVNETSYMIRFTPRRDKSIWSLVNTKRVNELIKAGRMVPRGLDAFAARDPKRTGAYSFETNPRELAKPLEKIFRANRKAWDFFNLQPPGYKRLMIFRIMSGKRDETRMRRLQQLIDISAQGQRMDLLKPQKSQT